MSYDDENERSNENFVKLQVEERDCLEAIFFDEFVEEEDGSQNTDWMTYTIRLEGNLALHVMNPPNYPFVPPHFLLKYLDSSGKRLSYVQEQALLRHINFTATEHVSQGTMMPCVLDCVYVARDFIESGELAEISYMDMISDDCLAHILSYVATSKESVDIIANTLRVFRNASKSDLVWKTICERYWKGKWGFERRWDRACKYFDSYQSKLVNSMSFGKRSLSSTYFWHERYEFEQNDSKRVEISLAELRKIKFECRRWFSVRGLIRQPDNLRDLLPTGLRTSFATDIRFSDDGSVIDESGIFRDCTWSFHKKGIKLTSPTTSSHFRISRLPNWGWQIWDSDFVFRGRNDDRSLDITLWNDFLSHLIIQQRPEWINTERASYPYEYREIPDDEDVMSLLRW